MTDFTNNPDHTADTPITGKPGITEQMAMMRGLLAAYQDFMEDVLVGSLIRDTQTAGNDDVARHLAKGDELYGQRLVQLSNDFEALIRKGHDLGQAMEALDGQRNALHGLSLDD